MDGRPAATGSSACSAAAAWARCSSPTVAGTPPAAPIRLAVLPFENLTGDPDQAYFSDGLTEEMITQLGRLHPQRLSVIARTSSMRYKHSQAAIDTIGRELGVDYLLEGSNFPLIRAFRFRIAPHKRHLVARLAGLCENPCAPSIDIWPLRSRGILQK